MKKAMNRDGMLAKIRKTDQVFDLCIIGGGATGLGTAVDAAQRGLSVVLIERDDFAKGTSSRSTKLVHGGVRYLRQGNLSLVLEALRERGRLLKNAPHVVSNQSFVIPAYHWWDRWFYGIGLKVYDALSGRLSLGRSRMLSQQETLRRIPTVKAGGLAGGVVYQDGQFDDARLAILLARTAEGLGAKIANYVSCVGLLKEKGKVTGVKALDHENGDFFEIKARAVVNATGVFVDEIRKNDDSSAQNIVAVSQGVHLVLPRRFLRGEDAIMIPKTSDGRVLFAVPWHGRVVLGTTDTPVDGPSVEPRALEEELQFIMQNAANYLESPPASEDVLSVFVGLRPLVKSDKTSKTAEISRDHTILESESGLITVTGGKWTTYRKMAEDVVDRVEQVAGMSHQDCGTAALSIHGWTEEMVDEALRCYGSDAAAVRSLGDGQVHPAIGLTVGEVRWQARYEMARTVEDVLSRRSRWLLLDARGSLAAARTVSEILAEELGKGADWVDQQVEQFTALAQAYVYEASEPLRRKAS